MKGLAMSSPEQHDMPGIATVIRTSDGRLYDAERDATFGIVDDFGQRHEGRIESQSTATLIPLSDGRYYDPASNATYAAIPLAGAGSGFELIHNVSVTHTWTGRGVPPTFAAPQVGSAYPHPDPMWSYQNESQSGYIEDQQNTEEAPDQSFDDIVNNPNGSAETKKVPRSAVEQYELFKHRVKTVGTAALFAVTIPGIWIGVSEVVTSGNSSDKEVWEEPIDNFRAGISEFEDLAKKVTTVRNILP